MDKFFESEKEYNRTMLFYFSNIYMLFHIYCRNEYYESNILIILAYCFPIYFLSSLLKLEKEDFENIQIILTSLVFVYDINTIFIE